MKKFRLGGLILCCAASYCIAAQPTGLSGSQAEPVHGTLLARSTENGDWRTVEKGQVDQGSWLRTEAGCEAVIALRNDAHLRMAENTSVHISQSSASGARLEVLEGKILSDVPEHGRSTVAFDTPEGVIQSSGGVTVVEVKDQNTSVNSLTGSASVQAEKISVPGFGVLPGRKQAQTVTGVELAMDGPDVRRRNKRRQPFVQGEETGPKRLGEDETPSPSPSPAVTPTPPPQTTVQPTPPPPNNTPVATSGGGGEIWPYLLGAAALGTGAYFLFRGDDEDNNNGNNNPIFFNNIPASP